MIRHGGDEACKGGDASGVPLYFKQLLYARTNLSTNASIKGQTQSQHLLYIRHGPITICQPKVEHRCVVKTMVMEANQMKDEKRIQLSSISPKAIGVSMEYL